MKICILNPTIIMRRSIAELACSLAEKGHLIRLIWPIDAFGSDARTKRHADKLLEHKNITLVRIKSLEFKSILWNIPLDIRVFSKIRAQLDWCDVMHIWTYFYPITLIPLFMKKKKPVILACDTFPSLSFSAGKIMDSIFKIFHSLFGRLIFGSVSLVHLYGKSMIKYAKNLNIKAEKIKVLRTGISPKKTNRTDSLRICDEFLITGKKKMILFVALLNMRKGVDLLIETAKKLSKKRDDFTFILVGDGPDKAKFERMVDETGINEKTKKIIFAGRRTDVPAFFDACSLFFLPSRGEGLAGVLMEAAVHGKPSVTSNIPCSDVIVEDSKTGYLCSTEDVDAYAEKIGKLLDDDSLCDRMGRNAREHIKSFDWAIVVERYEQMYEELIK